MLCGLMSTPPSPLMLPEMMPPTNEPAIPSTRSTVLTAEPLRSQILLATKPTMSPKAVQLIIDTSVDVANDLHFCAQFAIDLLRIQDVEILVT